MKNSCIAIIDLLNICFSCSAEKVRYMLLGTSNMKKIVYGTVPNAGSSVETFDLSQITGEVARHLKWLGSLQMFYLL